MPSFRTLRRTGIAVSSGSIVGLGTITIDVGGTAEVVTVTAETPLVQTASGERSFTVVTSVGEQPAAQQPHLRFAARRWRPASVVTPGAPGSRRARGGGAGQLHARWRDGDGSRHQSPGTRSAWNRWRKVKVVTLDVPGGIRAVGGPPDQRGHQERDQSVPRSLYEGRAQLEVERERQTNMSTVIPNRSKTNRTTAFRWAVRRPTRRPEQALLLLQCGFNPRTFGGDVNRYRVPTLLERQGDFSQTRDNNGNLYPFIKDPLVAGICSAADTRACFQDGGVVGRIPANRLYPTGMNILKWWPAPNIAQPAGQAYNFESVDPEVPSARLSAGHPHRLSADADHPRQLQVPRVSTTVKVIPGTIPGFNDTQEHDFGIWLPAGTFNWTMNSTMFLEASLAPTSTIRKGARSPAANQNYCRTGLSVTSAGNRIRQDSAPSRTCFPMPRCSTRTRSPTGCSSR
jgi:hypothetical protein